MTATRQNPARPVSLSRFGAVANGPASSSASTSAALNAFGKWARAESAAGRAVHVTVPPGTYYFDQTIAVDCFKGISTLVFDAHGATFLQTSPTGFPWPVGCDTVLYRNAANPRIRAARKGDARVVVSTPADLRHYAPGEMVMIAGQDIQYGGYPPNLYRFDFVRIRTVDPASGVVTFDSPLTHGYRPDFPSYPAQNKWDGSRLYKLDRGGFTWDIDHSFLGLTCRHAGKAHSNYILAMGRRITFRDCDTPGFAESVCEDFFAERCIERFHSEPDKLVKRSVRRGGRILAGIGMQSASVDQVRLEDCKIELLGVGGKSLTVTNCDIARMGFSGALGFCDEAVFDNCRIAQAQYCYPSCRRAAAAISSTAPMSPMRTASSPSARTMSPAWPWAADWRTGTCCRASPSPSAVGGRGFDPERLAHRQRSRRRPGRLGRGSSRCHRDRHHDQIGRRARLVVGTSGGEAPQRPRLPQLQRRRAGPAGGGGRQGRQGFRHLVPLSSQREDDRAGPGAAGPHGPAGSALRERDQADDRHARRRADAGGTGRLSREHHGIARPFPDRHRPDHRGQRDFTVAALRGAASKDRVLYDARPQPHLPADLWCDNGMPNLFCTGAPFAEEPRCRAGGRADLRIRRRAPRPADNHRPGLTPFPGIMPDRTPAPAA